MIFSLATWSVIANALVAVLGALQGLDWVHILPQGGDMVASTIAGINTVLHLFAGPGPLTVKKQ